jgi:hypothetical protein
LRTLLSSLLSFPCKEQGGGLAGARRKPRASGVLRIISCPQALPHTGAPDSEERKYDLNHHGTGKETKRRDEGNQEAREGSKKAWGRGWRATGHVQRMDVFFLFFFAPSRPSPSEVHHHSLVAVLPFAQRGCMAGRLHGWCAHGSWTMESTFQCECLNWIHGNRDAIPFLHQPEGRMNQANLVVSGTTG